jgi:hypothetical protein
MPVGPGIYDQEVTDLMASTQASAIILHVFNGNRGSGFSVQARGDITAALPEILRQVADRIEESLQ